MKASYSCYQLSPILNRGQALRLLPDASRGGVLSSQMMGFHLLRKEKMEQYFLRVSLSSKSGQVWLRCISINSKKDALKKSIMKKNERKLSFSYEKGLILANSLMFMLPFQTLAETCETDSSVLSMPVLFCVALIGAVVGGASLQRQGKFKDAILYYSRVLGISKIEGDDSATTEAYGAIADCFTELGDLERAAKFYDKYIEKLETN